MAGEGDTGHMEPGEAQTAATVAGEPGPDVHTGDPDPASGTEAAPAKRRGRKRKAKRAARRVRPAEPDARAAAAAADGESLGFTPPAAALEGGAEPAAELEGGAEPAGELEGPAALEGEALEALAAESAPVFRVLGKAAALALRARGYATAAASFYEGAPMRGEALAATVGVRLARVLGGKLAIAAIVAELLEPFADDRWKLGAAK